MEKTLNSVNAPESTEAKYRDRKRYAWLLALLVPLMVGFGPVLMLRNHVHEKWRQP